MIVTFFWCLGKNQEYFLILYKNNILWQVKIVLNSNLSVQFSSQKGLYVGSAPAETGPKCRALEEGEKLNHSLVNKHLVWLISGDETVQLIIYEAKNGNL